MDYKKLTFVIRDKSFLAFLHGRKLIFKNCNQIKQICKNIAHLCMVGIIGSQTCIQPFKQAYKTEMHASSRGGETPQRNPAPVLKEYYVDYV